jgi:hypothetical protein
MSIRTASCVQNLSPADWWGFLSSRMAIASDAWPFRQVIAKAEAARQKISQPVASRDDECVG